MAAAVDIILGAPGSGKSEQAKRLAASRRYVRLSTGDLLRAEGDQTVQDQINQGVLVPSQVVQKLLEQAITKVDPNLPILLDGFPREKGEAKWLDDSLPKLNRQLGKAIFVNVPETEAMARLQKRARPDDKPDTEAKRFRDFEHQTMPVINHYKHHGQMAEIDGVGTPDEVAARIEAAL